MAPIQSLPRVPRHEPFDDRGRSDGTGHRADGVGYLCCAGPVQRVRQDFAHRLGDISRRRLVSIEVASSTKGGWKSVAMVVRYEHASEERDALLAQVLNQFAENSNVVPIASASPGDRARSAHDDPEVEGEVLDLPPLTSENEGECSGGETRTHNLAVNSRLLCH